jgi:hypothetical protein
MQVVDRALKTLPFVYQNLVFTGKALRKFATSCPRLTDSLCATRTANHNAGAAPTGNCHTLCAVKEPATVPSREPFCLRVEDSMESAGQGGQTRGRGHYRRLPGHYSPTTLPLHEANVSKIDLTGLGATTLPSSDAWNDFTE